MSNLKKAEEVKEILEDIMEDKGYKNFVNALVLLEEGRILTDDEYEEFMNHPVANLLSIQYILGEDEI